MVSLLRRVLLAWTACGMLRMDGSAWLSSLAAFPLASSILSQDDIVHCTTLHSQVYSRSDASPDQIDCIIEHFTTSFKLAQSKTEHHSPLLLWALRCNDTGDLCGVQLSYIVALLIGSTEESLGCQVSHG